MRMNVRGWEKLTADQRNEVGKLFTDMEKYYKIGYGS